MADKEKNDVQEEKNDKGKVSKKTVVMIVLIVFMLFGIAGGVTYYFVNQMFSQVSAEEAPPVEKFEFPLDNFVVNVADTDNRRYLKVNVVLVYTEEEMEEELEKRTAEMRNSIIDILRKKTMEDVQKENATETIRTEVAERVNSILPEGEILEVYLTDFITQ